MLLLMRLLDMRYKQYNNPRWRHRVRYVDLRQDAGLVGLQGQNELGFSICEYPDGRLTRGPVTEGTPTSVSISLDCPPGSELVALWHSHPYGVARPSQQDLREARRLGVPHIAITQPQRRETVVFTV